MRRIDLDDMIPSIDDSIQYIDCKSGDTFGTLKSVKTNGAGRTVSHFVSWDGVSKGEIDALLELQNIIRKNT